MDDRIFATPSVILLSSGSVGVALLMWVLGALIAIAGTTVYVELGTVRVPSRTHPYLTGIRGCRVAEARRTT